MVKKTRKKTGGRKPNKAGVDALTKITSMAKSYRKQHPKAEWKSAIAHASAQYRAKH